MFRTTLKNSLKTVSLFLFQLIISSLVFITTFILVIGTIGYDKIDLLPYFLLTIFLGLFFSTLLEWLFLTWILSSKAPRSIDFSTTSTKTINEIVLIALAGITLMTIVAGITVDISTLGLKFALIINNSVAIVLAYKLKK